MPSKATKAQKWGATVSTSASLVLIGIAWDLSRENPPKYTGVALSLVGVAICWIVAAYLLRSDWWPSVSRWWQKMAQRKKPQSILEQPFILGVESAADKRSPLEFERRVHLQKWEDKGGCRCFYFFVCNRDKHRTINGIKVKLEETEPSVPNLNWLPVPLFQKHDNEAGPRQKEFSLHPREKKAIDLVALRQHGKIEIRHVVEGVNRYIPLNRYLFRVSISGRDVPQIAREFVVSHDNVERLLCADYARLLSELPSRVHTLHAEITKLKDTDPSNITTQEQLDKLKAEGFRWSRDLDDLVCCAYSPNRSRLIISPSGGRATGHPAVDAILLYRHWHSKLQELMKEKGL